MISSNYSILERIPVKVEPLLSTPNLLEIYPNPLPERGVEKAPELILDMMTVTMDVKSVEKQWKIIDQIKSYRDERVTKQYMANHCKSNYHNTWRFTVNPKEGKPFTVKLSYSPIDAQSKHGKRKFLRIEFNPRAVGGDRMWIFRKVLSRLLGKDILQQLWEEAIVTRVDFALDFKGIEEELYLYKTTARSSSIYHGKDAQTHYVGSKRSRSLVRWYDKGRESASPDQPAEQRWQRLEAETRDLRCSPSALRATLKNPFSHLRCYSAGFLKDQFSRNERLERKFRESVRSRGLNATFEADTRWKKGRGRYLSWLEACGYRRHLFDPADVWAQLDEALAVLNGLSDEGV